MRSRRKPIKPQQIAMLEYLGVPYRNQPKATADKQFLLEKYEKLDEEKYAEAYEIIVFHRIPQHLIGNAEAASAKQIGEAIEAAFEGEDAKVTLHAREETRKVVKELEEKVNATMGRIEQSSLGLAKSAIAEASKKFVQHTVKVGSKKPKKIDGVLPEYFDTLLQLAAERKNILLVGPAGSGKTHTAELLAQALELPYASQSCSAGVSESVFTGWLLPIGDSGKFAHVASAFLNCYENGGVFLLDEIDRADPNVAVFLNQALANGRFFLPQRFEKPEVVKHPDFIAIAAGNTFGGGADAIYHSANALDGSTLDRFRMGTIAVDYSPAVEQTLVDPAILEWGLKVRAVIVKHKMRRIMSTRVLIDATDMMERQDWTLDKIADTYFGDWSREEMVLLRNEVAL